MCTSRFCITPMAILCHMDISMTSKMQITAILLKNYRQFRSFYSPLVNPNTDEPLQNICFIGANATGKSTLLALIAKFLDTGKPQPATEQWDDENWVIGFKVRVSNDV